jgi:putative SOS response-associated peptidase YedK
MCGRYSLSATPETIAEIFGVRHVSDIEPRFNIAPTQLVPVVRRAEKSDERRIDLLKWGLVPSWADDPGIGSRMINARAETVGEKPSFRGAFKSRRCLVPVDGFYEWRKTGSHKVPYLIRRPEGGLFAFAGLWERWKGPSGPLESYAIITTEANDLMRPIHDRMPVIVDPEGYDAWLDPATPSEALREMLRPEPGGQLVAFPVSTRVNSPSNDDPGLQEPTGDDVGTATDETEA